MLPLHWLHLTFDCVTHNQLWKILKGWEYQTTLPVSWEICIDKKQQLESDMEQQTFKIGKGVQQSCALLPCLFNFYANYIIQNVRLEDLYAGIKIVGRNINNLRYVDDSTLMAECEEELKSLLMRVNEESEKAGLKLSVQKLKTMASSSITSWQIDGKKWKQWQILFSWAPESLWTVTAAMKLKDSCSLEESLWQT